MSITRVGDLGEKRLLEYVRRRLPAPSSLTIGVGDDCAAFDTVAGSTLITTDAMVEGVHFRSEWTTPGLLGRKALSVNLSDVAAMGGRPLYATVSLILPADQPFAWLEALYDGMIARAQESGVALIGGNIAATTGPVVIDIALIGSGQRLWRRTGARVGDRIAVTGFLGSAAAGLEFLRQGSRVDSAEVGSIVGRCLLAQLDPHPPVEFARAAGETEGINAAIDLSDGLSGDLRTLCEESGVSAEVVPADLPVFPELRARAGSAQCEEWALHGGEDYQLLLAVAPNAWESLARLANGFDVTLTAIGRFGPGPAKVELARGTQHELLISRSHEHFISRATQTDPRRP